MFFEMQMDVGCGSGILSLFALRAGARRVYGVEASSTAKLAKKVARVNGYGDRFTIVNKRVEDILPSDIEEVYFILFYR